MTFKLHTFSPSRLLGSVFQNLLFVKILVKTSKNFVRINSGKIWWIDELIYSDARTYSYVKGGTILFCMPIMFVKNYKFNNNLVNFYSINTYCFKIDIFYVNNVYAKRINSS